MFDIYTVSFVSILIAVVVDGEVSLLCNECSFIDTVTVRVYGGVYDIGCKLEVLVHFRKGGTYSYLIPVGDFRCFVYESQLYGVGKSYNWNIKGQHYGVKL